MEGFLHRTFLDNQMIDWIWFTGTVLAVLLLSKPLSNFLGHLIYRLFRKLSEESRARQFLDLLQKPLSRFLVFLTIYLSFNFLRYPEALDFTLYNITFREVLHALYQTILAVSVIVVTLRLVDFLVLILQERAEKTESRTDDQMVLFVRDILKVIVIFGGIFLILGVILGLNITSLLAGAGIAGLAVAFAAKESIENLIGSFTIFIDKPFTVGDFVQVGDVMGTVEKVGFRSTRIRTVDKTWVTLPNRKIIDSTSENLSLRTYRRVRNFIGLTYDTKPDQIQAIVKDIQDLIDGHELTNQDGVVGFYEFGDSSLNILVLYYVQNLDYNVYVKVREEINFKIMEIVSRHGSDFAFPTQTIHLAKDES